MRSTRRVITVLSVLTLAACSGLERNPPPPELADRATIPGMERVRWYGDEEIPEFVEWMALPDEVVAAEQPATYGKEHNLLVVSGGGSNGAYGAGVLVGWTESGERPEFTMVTGISIGALAAPFAFLGPRYDPVLEEVCTTLRTEDLVRERGLLAILTSDALADTNGLREVIAKYVTAEVVEEIAAEHRRGRELFVATTNLDAGRAVIWDIGGIADHGGPGALQLIRQVLLASASIPVAFPPVLIEVDVDGERYDEMHVDGGVAAQAFLHPGVIDLQAAREKLRAKGKPTVWVIRNGYLKSEWQAVERRTTAIAGRAISTMIQFQGQSDLYRIYSATVLDGMEYRQTSIPRSFTTKPNETFDPEYMRALFDFGRERGRVGTAWREHPPEVEIIREQRR